MNGRMIFRGEARRLRYNDGVNSCKQIFTACVNFFSSTLLSIEIELKEKLLLLGEVMNPFDKYESTRVD